MKKNGAEKDKYSTARLTKIMGYVLFGTVFLMSFLFIDKNIRTNAWVIILSVFGGLIVVEIIVWIALYFSFKKKQKTENDYKIEEAIKRLEQEPREPLDEEKENDPGVISTPVDIKE